MPEPDFEAASASLAAVLVPLNRAAPERVMTSAFHAEAKARDGIAGDRLMARGRILTPRKDRRSTVRVMRCGFS